MRFTWKSILILITCVTRVFTCWADEQPKSNSDASNSDDQKDASHNQQSSSLEDDELYIKVERVYNKLKYTDLAFVRHLVFWKNDSDTWKW